MPPLNKTYTGKDFTDRDLSKTDPGTWNGTVVKSMCLYQQATDGIGVTLDPRKHVLPPGIKDVVFEGCNLDNCHVPAGATMVDCTNKRIRVQNDLDDWELDSDNKPVKPVATKLRQRHGVSIKPEDLPTKPFTAEEREAFEATLSEAAR